jgi:hypothetical protein
MARNGSGNYSREVADFTPNATILSADVNQELDAIATALTDSIARDGQTTPSANLPMGTYRHTGVGNASARTHYAAAGQAQDSAFLWGGTAAGSADARTISLTPAITAYAAGQVFRFINGAAANTGAATLAVSGLAATAVRKGEAATALAAGDLPADAAVEVLFDGTVFRLMAVQPSGIGVTAMRAASVSGFGALPLSGGTLTSALSVTGTVNVFGPAASARSLYFGTDAERRWILQATDTAESGANAGSDLRLIAYQDDDATSQTILEVTRSTGVLDFKVTPTINGVAITPGADITGVTAGTGLTGGGTSGAVTLSVNTTLGDAGTYAIAQNNSGFNVALGATTAGSNLSPSKSGTWQNMGDLTAGGTVSNTAMALWVRTV